MQPLDWSLPFLLMCDASDCVIRAILGQCRDKKLYIIYYASKTLNDVQIKYKTMKKEFLVILIH